MVPKDGTEASIQYSQVIWAFKAYECVQKMTIITGLVVVVLMTQMISERLKFGFYVPGNSEITPRQALRAPQMVSLAGFKLNAKSESKSMQNLSQIMTYHLTIKASQNIIQQDHSNMSVTSTSDTI